MNGPVAIVTGASRGIGRAAAFRLAANGISLVLSGRSAEELAALSAEMNAAGARALTVVADIRDDTTPESLVDAAPSEFGRLDALVNSAAIARAVPILELDLETWQGSLTST